MATMGRWSAIHVALENRALSAHVHAHARMSAVDHAVRTASDMLAPEHPCGIMYPMAQAAEPHADKL
jgi:hypothetical protein